MFEYICFIACILCVICSVACTINSFKCKKLTARLEEFHYESLDVMKSVLNGWKDVHRTNKQLRDYIQKIFDLTDRTLLENSGLRSRLDTIEKKLKEKENA